MVALRSPSPADPSPVDFTDGARLNLWTAEVPGGGGIGGGIMARLGNDAVIAAFCRYQRKRNLSESTIRHRRFRLLALAAQVELLVATTAQIDRWLDQQGGDYGLAPQTRYTYLAYLTSFYVWALRERLIKKDPTEELIRPKLPQRVPRPWNPEEVAGAIETADPRMRCWLLLAWFCGCRCMEMAAMRVEDMHDGAILLHGKGNKERTVPLHPLVGQALRAYGLPRAGYVFRRRDGRPLQPATISRYVGRYLHDLGIEATAHMGRHRFGTDLYEASNGDLLMAAELMGHANPSTTMGYAAWARSKAAAVVGQLKLPDGTV